MKYKVYKIINKINSKVYVGVTKNSLENRLFQHSTYKSYIGRAIRKHGIDNFDIICIHKFESTEEMYNKEKEIVNEEFIDDVETYNLAIGGNGGFSKDAQQKGLKAMREALELLRLDEDWVKKTSLNISIAQLKYFETHDGTFTGKKHSNESKAKIGQANSIHQKGEGNSQFGTMWIYNLEEKKSKKIKKDEFPKYEVLGWLKGRKIKF